MTEVLRPSIYGAQHPVVHLGKSCNSSKSSDVCSNNNGSSSDDAYIVVGHCCESGDLFTCAPGEPETLLSRSLISSSSSSSAAAANANAKSQSISCIEIGDLKNYNSFPEAPEVLIDTDGKIHVIRGKQTLDQIIENEIPFRKVGSK